VSPWPASTSPHRDYKLWLRRVGEGPAALRTMTIRHRLVMSTFFERIMSGLRRRPARLFIYMSDFPPSTSRCRSSWTTDRANFMAALAQDPNLAVVSGGTVGPHRMRVVSSPALDDDAWCARRGRRSASFGKLHNDRFVLCSRCWSTLIGEYKAVRGRSRSVTFSNRRRSRPSDRRTVHRYVARSPSAPTSATYTRTITAYVGTQCINRGMSLEAIAGVCSATVPWI